MSMLNDNQTESRSLLKTKLQDEANQKADMAIRRIQLITHELYVHTLVRAPTSN
jgi:hypothetical protein